MLEELEQIIEYILVEHKKSNEKWRNSEYYYKMNLKKIEVRDVPNSEILDHILNYREFININNIELMNELKEKFSIGNTKIYDRVKVKNSVEYKIKHYIADKEEKGKSPIDKCLNDLFGVRAIYNGKIDFDTVNEFVKQRFSKDIKCINAIRGNYKAIHIYFKEDNFNFQWELQIWSSEDANTNFISHEKYKKDYAGWESENKGGAV